MLPPSGKPNKSGSILKQNGSQAQQHVSLPIIRPSTPHLPAEKKKNQSNISQPIPPSESQNHGNTATRVWPVTQTTSHETFL